MKEAKSNPNEEPARRIGPGMRLVIAFAVVFCLVAGYFVIGMFLHRDEGAVKTVKSREELVEAVAKLPDAIVPELPAAEDPQYTVHLGVPGRTSETSGYLITWKGVAGDAAAAYELDCDQTGGPTKSHELYRDVFIENSAYEKKTAGDWTVVLRFTLGEHVYALRGRCETDGLTEEAQTAAKKALEAELRPILEQIIDRWKE